MQTANAGSPEFLSISVGRKATLWALFFLICMGLGYPTLNRYDPRSVTGLYDTRAYAAMVMGAPLQADQSDLAQRVLVPYLARPIYWLASGHLKSWNPVFFALLAANSFFIATSASLLVGIGHRITSDYSVAILSGFVYLTNFAVANFNLSGYVDSGVSCILLAITWTLLVERWWLLPLWGVLGALAKETFVPLSAALAIAWWFVAFRKGTVKLSQLAWIAAMAAVGLAIVAFLMSRNTPPDTPLSFASSRLANSGAGYLYLSGLVRCLRAREFIFTFGWLLPFSLFRVRRLPGTWVAGSACAAFAALAMGAYDDALGNATRAVFSACGPLLSLSVSILLAESGRRERA